VLYDSALPYVVFETVDADRARAFYDAVLGLRFSPGRPANGWNIADFVPCPASHAHRLGQAAEYGEAVDQHVAVGRLTYGQLAFGKGT
jgi:catechol 2,3-dioxygenase-like lactoylglutathione lyase family enzyme